MIENKIDTTVKKTVATTGTTTSPISKSYTDKKEKTSGFKAWLRDEETDSEVTIKSATASFAKGLIEIVKTVYKKPVLCSLIIATGVVLTTFAQAIALPAIMYLSVVSGAAALVYSAYSAATRKTNIEKKQAYELMGIATFVLAIGVCGLLI